MQPQIFLSAKQSAEKAVIPSSGYKTPAPVSQGVSVANAAPGAVPAPFVFSYANSSGSAQTLRLGDPTGFLSQPFASTVAPSSISFGYTDAMLTTWLTKRTLSVYQIDYQVTTSVTQFNNAFKHISGYGQETDPQDLSSYVVQAKNPQALDPKLLKVRFDRSWSFGIEGAFFLTVNDGETVNLTLYFNAIF